MSAYRFRRKHRALPFWRLLFAVIVLACIVAWHQEWIGSIVRGQVNRWFLPRSLLDGRLTLQPFALEPDAAEPPLVEGFQLTVSPEWVRTVLRGSPFPGFLVPPGLVKHGLMTSGSVFFSDDDGSDYLFPFYVDVRDDVGLVPHIKVRFPASYLNVLLDDAFADDWTERGEYLLGSYDLDQRIRFDRILVWTVDTDAARPLYPLVFRATATGQLRYRFRDGWFRARVTARVRELTISFVLIPVAHPDGIGLDYRARVETLDLRVRRMPRWVERRLAKSVRSSLQRSLNHRRKRERLARQRLPLWLPMALSVDIEIVNPEDPAEESSSLCHEAAFFAL